LYTQYIILYKYTLKMETKTGQGNIKANEIALMIQNERITKAEAASMLSVSLGTISNYIKKGLLKQIKLGITAQSPVYLKRDEVLKLLDFEIRQSPFDRK
jgi:hypothetical protein